MGIVRVKKHKEYFVILDKTCINDPALSFKAKGIHTYLMGLPDDWSINMEDLENRSLDGRMAVRSGMKELLDYGYAERTVSNQSNGRLNGWDYVVYESPIAIISKESDQTPSMDEVYQQLHREAGFPPATNPPDDNPPGGCPPGVKVATTKEEETKEPITKEPIDIKRFAKAWQDIVNGVPPYARLGKALKRASTLFKEESLYNGWVSYLNSTDARYVSPESFVAKAGTWCVSTEDEIKSFERMLQDK